LCVADLVPRAVGPLVGQPGLEFLDTSSLFPSVLGSGVTQTCLNPDSQEKSSARVSTWTLESDPLNSNLISATY
jgi:hypothetical protein